MPATRCHMQLPCLDQFGNPAQVWLEDTYNVGHDTWLNGDGPLSDSNQGVEWQWLMGMTYYIARSWLAVKIGSQLNTDASEIDIQLSGEMTTDALLGGAA